MTESSISFSKGQLLKKQIVTREETGEGEDQPKKQRYLQFTVLFTNVNRSNFNSDSLDRDPLTLQWEICTEPFSSQNYTLMRSNLQNFLCSQKHNPIR